MKSGIEIIAYACAGTVLVLCVVMFLMQTPFMLPGNTRYRVDFQVFWHDGRVTFEDTKGRETETFKLKKRQVEEIYPVEIEVI